MDSLTLCVERIMEAPWRHYVSEKECFFDFSGTNTIPDGTLVSDLISCFQKKYPNSLVTWCDNYHVAIYDTRSGILVKYM